MSRTVDSELMNKFDKNTLGTYYFVKEGCYDIHKFWQILTQVVNGEVFIEPPLVLQVLHLI